jgi:MoaA/NifB/PqqE/SkfB family radical SAM enzyme
MAVKSTETMISDPDREKRHANLVNKELRIFFLNALRISLSDPRQAFAFLRTVVWQTKAARLRARWKRQDVHVPPIMIFSITNRCNLHCKGCYAQALRPSPNGEMSSEQLQSVFTEARELGISFAVLAGGEPLVRPEILEITKEHPEILSLLFTNGLLIDEDVLAAFKEQRHLVPVISLEGYEEDTDGRRGRGVYDYLQTIIPELKERGIFFAVAMTVTRSNYPTVTGEPFIEDLLELGCQMLIYLEYTPIREGTEDWVITDEQRASMPGTMEAYRHKYPALFVAVPGDESRFSGGCLAAGRGFVHISAEGDVEACPFAPYSDTSLRDLSLKDALQSDLLRVIRQNAIRWREKEGDCALWGRRERIHELLSR